jgi:hypothetical protein
MTAGRRTPLPALAALVGGVLSPGMALALERSCAAMAIEPDAAFQQRFPDLLESIEGELRARPDIDACARVSLQLREHDAIDVSVTLPDGRAASRSVARRDDVVPTLQALLLVPEQQPAAPAPAAAPAPERRARRVEPAVRADRDVAPSTSSAARQLGFELSVITGARLGDGQFGYGAGALSFLEIKSWLIGFEGRADDYRPLAGGDPETALELALLAGKRLAWDTMALDLTLGPGVAMKGFAFSDTNAVQVSSMQSGMPPTLPAVPPEERSSGPVARLLVGARLGFSSRSVFRTFIGFDGEIGPARAAVAPNDVVSSPRMPTYTVGLALGATVGTP